MFRAGIFLFCLLLSALLLNAQEVKLISAMPQRSTLKTQEDGFKFSSVEENAVYHNPFHKVIEHANKLYKVSISASKGVLKKSYTSLHIIRLSKDLTIEEEYDVDLQSDNKGIKVRPLEMYVSGDKINLITMEPLTKQGEIIVSKWQINISDMSLTEKNKQLATINTGKGKSIEYITDLTANNTFGVVFAAFEKKHGTEATLFALSVNPSTGVIFNKSAVRSINYRYEEILKNVRINDKGEIWGLIGETTKKDETANFVFHLTGKGISFFELTGNEGAVIHGALGLAKDGTGLVAGLSGSSVELFRFINGNFSPVAKKAINNGQNIEYTYINDILERDNGLIDIIACEVASQEIIGNFTRKIESGALYILSFQNNNLTKINIVNRNLVAISSEHQPRKRNIYNYSTPASFVKNNELYILFVANSTNTNAKNNNRVDLSQSVLLAGKLDAAANLKSKLILDFNNDEPFDAFHDMHFCKITDGKYFGYRETEFTSVVKAKLSFASFYIQ